MCIYSGYYANKYNFAAPTFQSLSFVKNYCVNSSASLYYTFLYLIVAVFFYFKEIIDLLSYSMVNYYYIIIFRAWIISRSERERGRDSCSGEWICYIFTAVMFWTKAEFRRIYLMTNTLTFISKETGLQQPKHDKYMYCSFITSLFVHFHGFQK